MAGIPRPLNQSSLARSRASLLQQALQQLDLLGERAITAEGARVRRLPSGAGHDGMAMKTLTDIAMLFVRCKGGISHNPAEAISEADAAVGARTLLRFIEDFELPA